MSLPTSGFTTRNITLQVGASGLPFNFLVNVNVNDIGSESLAEEILAVLEPALVALAGDLENVTGATTGYVYKGFNGEISPVDIS
jgi:hypothetical protein